MNARLRSAAIEHARELAQAQAAVAALSRGALQSRDAEIAELKRARMHVSTEDVGGADSGGDAGAGACGATWQRRRRWRWLQRRRQY